MTSLIKNQILKHLTKFFKDLAPEQLQLSAFKGSCELNDLRLEEKVLMELLSFPAWIKINKAVCDQLTIRIPWTKIKSVPIQMNLNEVTVEVEVCEEFRDIGEEAEENNLSNFINTQAPGKYGFVDRVIDGITVTVNNVLITFKSKIMSATFNLSRVILESRCPNWKPGELSLTRIKDPNRGQILLFKIVEWQTMRLEAKCLTDPNQAPLRLITNHAQCRLTIKKNLDDCSVVAARIFVIFEDILWVLTFAQFISAASFIEYIFALVKRSPMGKKSGLQFNDPATPLPHSDVNQSATSFGVPPPTSAGGPYMSPMNTPKHGVAQAPILTGNLSSASLIEQKFLCYDLVETSLHLYIDKVDAHLYDDIEISPGSNSSRDSGGALQTTLDQIQVDCYPYSRATCDRRHWYKWFDPSPNSRRHWINGHFAEFDLVQVQKMQAAAAAAADSSNLLDKESESIANIENKMSSQNYIPIATDEQLLSLTVLVKIKDYCMNCVATRHSMRGVGLNKFIQTDKDYQMPSEMPSLYLELNYFYYFDMINRMMVYDNVPDPLAFIHLSPTKLLFDSPTLIFLNSFQVNLSKALSHLEDLFPEETTAPKIHCRIEILMPQISLPAKPTESTKQDTGNTSTNPKTNNAQNTPLATSSLLVKSGKITLSSSLHDKDLMKKLMDSIEKLRENPSQPINLGGYQTNASKKDNSCTGDWTKVWNASLINGMTEFSLQNQLWAIQFEPVWMDFMNYDIDELSSGQRLEPIVEPVNAYAFIHLNLSNTLALPTSKSGVSSSSSDVSGSQDRATNKKRDVISILVSVLDGSILANMDKIQFGFLQRLGMHVEKLLQQIKADASTMIQMDTVVEDTLEVNLTAYIKEIKARLILDKKIEKQIASMSDSFQSSGVYPPQIIPSFVSSAKTADSKSHELIREHTTAPRLATNMPRGNLYDSSRIGLSSPNLQPQTPHESDRFITGGVAYSPQVVGDSTTGGIAVVELGSTESLDECTEVADDASCLFLGDTTTSTHHDQAASKTTNSMTDIAEGQRPPKSSEPLVVSGSGSGVGSASGEGSGNVGGGSAGASGDAASRGSATGSVGRSPIEESLLIDLNEMEQASNLFAKVNLSKLPPSPQPPAATKKDEQEESLIHQQQQERKQSNQFTNNIMIQQTTPPQTATQEIETESISYLELSMSRLMVRRITETKRRSKF